MRYFYIILINHCISHSCINLLMPHQLLYLFDRHPFINGSCCHRPSKKIQRFGFFSLSKLYASTLDSSHFLLAKSLDFILWFAYLFNPQKSVRDPSRFFHFLFTVFSSSLSSVANAFTLSSAVMSR